MRDQLLEIQVWAINLEQESLPAPSYPADQDRAAHISDPSRLSFFLQGRHALRSILGHRLNLPSQEVEIKIAVGGKPFVEGCQFSLSHSGPWLVVAVSDSEVGIDVESANRPRRSLALAERFFSTEDFHALREVDETQRDSLFLRQWVAKEAALKCHGSGLASHLDKAICVMKGGVLSGVRWDAGACSICEYTLPDHARGAVAWPKGAAHILWRTLSEIGVS